MMERMSALRNEATAFLVQQGVPEHEITEEALFQYAWERFTPQERETFAGVTRAQMAEDMAFAHFCVALDAVREEQGKPPLPLGMDDPERERRVRWLMERYRRQLADEAYWDDDDETE